MILYCLPCRIKINTLEYGWCPCPRCKAQMTEYVASDVDCARVAWRFPFLELDEATLAKLRVVSTIKKNWKLKKKVEGNLVAEHNPTASQTVTARRQGELAAEDDHYLARLYGLRVISAWTPKEAQLDITIQHQLSTSYLRDAYDDVKKPGALGVFNQVIDKLLAKSARAKTADRHYYLVNSRDVTRRLRYLGEAGKITACAIVCGVPGLYVLEITAPKGAEGDLRQYLKEVGATPSTFQAYKYAEHDGEAPALGAAKDVSNAALLGDLLNGSDFKKLVALAGSDSSLRHVFKTVVELCAGLQKETGLRFKDEFNRGVLVKNALTSIAGLVEILVASSKSAARSARYYDLILDELFLILAAVRHYRPDDLPAAEQAIQDRRNPLVRALAQTAGIERVIVPAWSGMDALVTALEAAREVSGSAVQLMQADRGQANYFEIPTVLASQGRVAKEGEVDKAAIVYATLDPSSPLAAPTTPGEVVETVRLRVESIEELDAPLPGVQVVSLVLDTTIQTGSGEHSHIDEVVGQLAYLVEEGKLQILLARSYQKYQGLGSTKVMGGAVTLLRATAGPGGSKAFLEAVRTGGNTSRDEWQFFTHLLKYASENELGMVGVSNENAEFVADFLFPNGGGVKYIHGLPFLMKSYAIESWLKNLDILQLDSFGLVTSTFLGVVGLGTRVTIGQESRPRLIEKFFAAGHLMPVDPDKPKAPGFTRVFWHLASIVKEARTRYEKQQKAPEKLPFNPEEPPPVKFGAAQVDPKYTVKGLITDYRVVKTVNMAVRAIAQSGGDGESDFDHVVASYLAFGFMVIRASDVYRKALVQLVPMSDRLTLIRLCRGLFSGGLLDRLTPEGRIQLSAYWLEALTELDDVAKAGQDCLTQFLREYGLDKRDFIEEPKHKGKVGVERGPELAQEIAEYGMYVPKHIAEQLSRRPDNSNLTLAVKRFVTRGYEINQKGPSTAPKLVIPGKVGAESGKPVDAALAFAQLKKELAEEKKKLELEIAAKAKATSEKSASTDGGVLKLVTAVSVIEQIEGCDTLAACYRASRALPPDEDLSKTSDDKMLAYVTSVACDLLADIAGSKKIERPAIIQVAPWKKIGDFQLTETHKNMVHAQLTEYLDDRIIDAFVAIVEQRRANVLRRYDIPVGNLIATQRWVPTPDLRGVRGGGGTRVEIQVLNQGGNHWVVAVRFPGENANAAYVYDPLQPVAISAQTQAQVRRCFSMADEHPVTRLAGPRQPLNYECGAYVCAAVEVLSRAGAAPLALRTALQQAAFVNNTIRANLYQSIEANNLAGF